MANIAISQDELRKIIEQMTAAKEAANVQRDQLNDLRREARSEGVNIQALNPLIEIMGEHRHDRGNKVLSDLVSYARAAGVELDPGRPRTEPSETRAATDSGPTREALVPTARAGPASSWSNGASLWTNKWARGTWHGGLAVAISATLLWLLH